MKSVIQLGDWPPLRSGDIIGFSGANGYSDFINVVTYGLPRWGISHVGIISDGLIFESTYGETEPCAVQGRPFNGTQAQKLPDRILRYQGRVWVYPLAKPLRTWEARQLDSFLVDGLGRPYDRAGAMRAGLKLWSWVQSRLREECLASLFCSEWVAAAHRHVDRFHTVHVGRWSPNAFVRTQVRRGVLKTPMRLK